MSTIIMQEVWPRRQIGIYRLTPDQFTVSLIVTKWVILRIPLGRIREVQVLKNIINREVAISYYNERDHFKLYSFYTPHYLEWGDAFRNVGVRVSHPDA